MPNVLFPPDGPQSVSQVLDTGFRIFRISLVRCLLFGAVAMIAGQLPNFYSLVRGEPFGGYLRGQPMAIGLAVAGNVLAIFFSAVILIHQRESAQGTRLPIRAELSEALRRLGALIGVALVSGALLALVPVALLVLPDVGTVSVSLRVAYGIGAALVAVPIIWLLPGLAMAVVAAVLTPNGTFASLKQGIWLVYRNWWRTIITFAVWTVLLVVLNLVAVILLMLSLQVFGASDVITLSAATPVAFVALRAIGLPFLVAILLAVYGELLVRKQGVDLERRVASMAQA
jgi:hypothetical protein